MYVTCWCCVFFFFSPLVEYYHTIAHAGCDNKDAKPYDHDLSIAKPVDKSNAIKTISIFPFLQNNKR
jgi:hypothetical protein